MTDTNFRGPANSIGAMEDGTVSITDGPNYAYQGTVFQNLRGGFFQKDGVGPGRVPAYLDNPQIVVVDNIPSAISTSALATATTIASGTVIPLITVAPGNTTATVPSHATGMPIIPFGASAPVTTIALDFGFTTGTTAAASSAVVVADNTLFTLGQWLAIGGAGNAGKTASLLTQVTSITGTTAITVFPVPTGTLNNAPIGASNLFAQGFLPPATQFGPGTSVPNAEANALAGGLFRLFNPVGALSRNLTVTTTTTSATGTITFRGFDIHAQAMSETITIATTVPGTVSGKKAFKYILSVTPNYTDSTGTYGVGVGDIFGLPIRMDRYEYLSYCWAGINQLNQTGFVAADLTSPATATTGDVRGTLSVATITGGSASNGVRRLWISQTLPLWNDITGTPTNTVPFFGQTQFTN